MGYSFDIQDDIIDSFAPKEEYGRSPCLDISKNKKPLHVIYALNSEDQTKSEALKCLLGKEFLNMGEIELARKLLRESGGLDAAKQESRKHAEQAKALITQTSLAEDAKEFFSSFIAAMPAEPAPRQTIRAASSALPWISSASKPAKNSASAERPPP